MDKKRVHIMVEIELEFPAYTTQRKNLRAAKYLRTWVGDLNKQLLGGVPMYLDKDSTGAAIEEHVTVTKVSATLQGVYNTFKETR